jgi:NTP pyrophosphatase (non-canonical NTP hydrolase)
MKIDLPNITIQDDWTIPGQIKKMLEEAGEVAEAVAKEDPVNTIREALDTMQTCATLINMVQAEWNLVLDRFLTEHHEKLERKGYL